MCIVYHQKRQHSKADVCCYVIASTITAVEFDPTGDYLVTGDKGGRMLIYAKDHYDQV